ncbi:MAG: hypothetical protein GYB53_17720 [Rhodobacteraceae bacterium]|nr:hypothetical protein [Paracoccaceae bacterium]MBR9822650.1 hypothetical protein [Paracoccaceae bacterium]
MKPNFALNILPEGLELLHRVSPGWERIGSVRFDAEDLPAELAALRRMGEAFDDRPLRCKLVIPNDQIRYMSIHGGAATEAERRETVLAELDGATPYALEQLQFCWSVSGSTTHVAAVADETLAEAEAFAMEHGFNPVSFVAVPEGGGFLGEPYFGPTAASEALVPGETVQRDAVPIHVIGNAALPAAALPQDIDTALSAAAEGEQHAPAVRPAAGQDSAEEQDPATGEGAAGPEVETETEAESGTESEDSSAPAAQARETSADDADGAPAGTTERAPGTPPATTGQEDAPRIDFRSRRDLFDVEPLPRFLDEEIPGTEPDGLRTFHSVRAPVHSPAPIAGQEPRQAPRQDPDQIPDGGQDEDLEDVRAQAALKASLDSLRPVEAEEGRGAKRRRGSDKRPRKENAEDRDSAATESRARRKPRRAIPPELPASGRKISVDQAPARKDPRAPAAGPAADRATAPSAEAPPVGAAPLAATRKGADAPRVPPSAPETPATASPARPNASLQADSLAERRAREAEKMTVFGERSGQAGNAPRRGAGRILVLALVLAALGAGAWVLLSRDRLLTGTDEDLTDLATRSEAAAPPLSDTAEAEAPLTSLPPAPDTLDQGSDLPAIAPARLQSSASSPEAGDTGAGQPTGPSSSETAIAPAAPTAAPSGGAAQLRPAPATPAEAAARYAATGIWQRAPAAPVPPLPTQLGDIDLAAMTPTDRAAPVTGLPDTARQRPLATFQSPTNPPAPDQEFELDPRGYVAATPDGAMTPEGHLAFLGTPPVTPPARPEATLLPSDRAAVPEQSTPPQTPGNEGAQDQGVVDLALSALEQTAPEATAPAPDAATASPDTGTPASDDPEAELAPGEQVTLAAAGSIRPRIRPADLVPEQPEPTDPDLAAGVASRPRARPEDFEILVAAAQAAGVRPPELVIPAPTVSAPGPSQPSVARLATVSNGIDLNRLNLIGVSGEPSARQALVRLADGRIRKVEVGDRLDGGQVAAIGDGELRYVKNNRSHLLTLPN